MIFEWYEINELGQMIRKQNEALSEEILRKYSNKKCRHCYGRGYQLFSGGKGYHNRNEFDLKATITERKVVCNCFDGSKSDE